MLRPLVPLFLTKAYLTMEDSMTGTVRLILLHGWRVLELALCVFTAGSATSSGSWEQWEASDFLGSPGFSLPLHSPRHKGCFVFQISFWVVSQSTSFQIYSCCGFFLLNNYKNHHHHQVSSQKCPCISAKILLVQHSPRPTHTKLAYI